MTFWDYTLLVYENLNLYVGLLVFMMGTFVLILKRQAFSVIDPMSILIFLLSIYTTTVIFLYTLNYSADFYLLIYLASVTALLLGLHMNGRPESNPKAFELENTLQYRLFFYLVVGGFLLTKSLLIFQYGVPLFATDIDRSVFYSKAGLLKLISDFFMAGAMFFAVERIELTNKKIRAFDVLLVASIFSILFLNGSKSDFFSVVLAFFLYRFYIRGKKIHVGLGPLVIGLVLFFSIIFVKAEFDLNKALLNFVLSIINRADSYVYVVTSNYDDMIRFFSGSWVKFIEMIFYIPLSAVGVISPTGDNMFFSQKLEQYIYYDYINLGPNAIYNLMPLLYVGPIATIAYSFLTGYMISFFRNRFLYIWNMNNTFQRMLFFIIQLNIIGLIAAPTLFWGAIIPSGIFLLMIYSISLLICSFL